MKIVYRILILFFVFIGSVYVLGQNIKEEKIDFTSTVEMEEATFPMAEIQVGDVTINLLHGYSGNLNASEFRDSIIPIKEDKSFVVRIIEQDTTIKKITYQITEVGSGQEVESGAVSALDSDETSKSAKFNLKSNLEINKEYAIKITAVTDMSKKIHFFSRIKQMRQSYLEGQTKFVMDFHNATFDKNAMENYKMYLETNYSATEESYANVTIQSSSEMVSWGTIKPKVITDVVPTIKEINGDLAAIELDYYVQVTSEDENGTEQVNTYYVTEFFRIRYTSTRVYLLAYERNMEQLFDFNQWDGLSNIINMGITNDSEVETYESDDNSKVCFVRNGSLWYYNMEDNKAVSVFSFMQEDGDYVRDAYNQHDIKVIDIDNEGNISFLVYGYMNRGDFEGRLGILLYRYYEDDNRIEEEVYIPMEEPYERIKYDIDGICYLSSFDVFYFSMNKVIYAYNLTTKKTSIIAENIESENFVLSEEGQFMAWQSSNEITNSKSITMMDLETGEQKIIEANNGDNICVLGMIDTNLIYGYVKSSDIQTAKDGTTLIPMYRVEIGNFEGKVIKSYEQSNIYVTHASVTGNTIKLNRVKRENGKLEDTSSDYIVTKVVNKNNAVTSKVVHSEDMLNELALILPTSFTYEKAPKVKVTVNTIITEDTTVNLVSTDEKELSYYVYALGHILNCYDNASDAIKEADDNMGIVIDSHNNIIWERSGTSTTGNVSGITMQYESDGVTSIGACLSMLLQTNKVSVNAKDLSTKATGMYELIVDYVKGTPLNLTGTTLEYVLYQVDKGHPVLAMESATKAVLITGYDGSSITVIDPVQKATVTMSKSKAQGLFSQAGSVYLTYVD